MVVTKISKKQFSCFCPDTKVIFYHFLVFFSQSVLRKLSLQDLNINHIEMKYLYHIPEKLMVPNLNRYDPSILPNTSYV